MKHSKVKLLSMSVLMKVSFLISACLICVVGIPTGAKNSENLFSELLMIIADAIVASGGGTKYTRQQYQVPQESSGISLSVYRALQTITKNDDLECVPRLLCEAAAGGNSGGSRLIHFDKYSLSKLVSSLQLGQESSPMLSFGKAVVLGLSNRGDPYSCIINYPKCPKDEKRLLYYLNNHRGGFFRFFDMKLSHINNQNGYYTRYPSTLKPNYYYTRKPNLLRGQKVADIYAKKYVSFQYDNGKNRKVIFPSDGSSAEPRIQTKVVRPEAGISYADNEHFTFPNNQRYGKSFQSSNFFPQKIITSTKPTSYITDRLPSKFHFPHNDVSQNTKFPESSELFFPST